MIEGIYTYIWVCLDDISASGNKLLCFHGWCIWLEYAQVSWNYYILHLIRKL